jgi:hypothetical protein
MQKTKYASNSNDTQIRRSPRNHRNTPKYIHKSIPDIQPGDFVEFNTNYKQLKGTRGLVSEVWKTKIQIVIFHTDLNDLQNCNQPQQEVRDKKNVTLIRRAPTTQLITFSGE